MNLLRGDRADDLKFGGGLSSKSCRTCDRSSEKCRANENAEVEDVYPEFR